MGVIIGNGKARYAQWLGHFEALVGCGCATLQRNCRVKHLKGRTHFIKAFGGTVKARIIIDYRELVGVEIGEGGDSKHFTSFDIQ